MPGGITHSEDAFLGLWGEKVKSIQRQIRGHYDYEEYLIRFENGEMLRFRGNSSADVEATLIRNGAET